MTLLLTKHLLVGVQEGHDIIQQIFKIYTILYLSISLLLHTKIDMNWCVDYTHMEILVISNLMQ